MASNVKGLEESLDSFEQGCADIGVKLENGLRGHIEKMFEKAFDLNKQHWEERGALVLAAARFAGRYAAAYANMKNSGQVRKPHAHMGLKEVQKLCTAREVQDRSKVAPRREWCRDVPIPDDPIEPEPA